MKSLTHAALLIGEDKTTLEARAKELAALAVCSEPSGGGACGVCENCRKAAAGIHPDIIYAGQTADKPRPKLQTSPGKPVNDLIPLTSVHAMRELQADAAVMPNEAPKKVYIIHDAEGMCSSAANAANAFLKLLEEPPPSVVFILTGARSGDFLPTIRSRCVTERVGGERSGSVAEPNTHAEAIYGAFVKRSYAQLAAECLKLEKGIKREEMLDVLNTLYVRFAENAKSGDRVSLSALDSVAPLAEQLRSGVNLGGGHVAGTLMVKLNDIILR